MKTISQCIMLQWLRQWFSQSSVQCVAVWKSRFAAVLISLSLVSLLTPPAAEAGEQARRAVTAKAIAARLHAEAEAEAQAQAAQREAQSGSKPAPAAKKVLRPLSQVSFSKGVPRIRAGRYKNKNPKRAEAAALKTEKAGGGGVRHIYPLKHKRYRILPPGKKYQEMGVASWYGPYFHGRLTSSGEKYDMYAMTAAHKVLPMNTLLLVRNLDNGKQTIVRVNDRGPFVDNRIIDLSYSAAKSIGMVQRGTATVELALVKNSTRNKGQEIRPVKKRRKKYRSNPYEERLHRNDSRRTNSRPVLADKAQEKREQREEYFVQIGSFAKADDAKRLKEHFTKAGHRIVIKKQKGAADGRCYRVLVFVGNYLERAERAEKILLAKGYSNAFLVAD